MNVGESRQGGVWVLSILGSVTHRDHQELEGRLLKDFEGDGPKKFVLNLSGVEKFETGIPMAVKRTMEEIRKRKVEIRLIPFPHDLHRSFRGVKFDTVAKSYPTVPEALRRF